MASSTSSSEPPVEADQVAQQQSTLGRRRRGLRWWLSGIAALLVLLGADVAWRNVELDRLLDQVELAKLVTQGFNAEVGKVFRASPQHPTRTPQQEEMVRRDLTRIAYERAVELILLRDGTSEMFIAPWHRSVQKAKKAHLAHVDALVEFRRDVSGDPDRVHGGAPDIEANRLLAARAFRRAIPMISFDWFAFRGRIDKAFGPVADEPRQ